MSADQPWSVVAATLEAQRVLRAMGCPQRFSFYCIRRGVVNVVTDCKYRAVCGFFLLWSNYFKAPHSSQSRKKQLVGHDGPDDRVYKKYYQSKQFPVDTGNIYRQEETRSEKADDLCMRHKWDPSCPSELSKNEKESLYQADETLKTLVAEGDALKIRNRRVVLQRAGLEALRKDYFKVKEESGLESLPTVDQLSSLTELNEQSILDGSSTFDKATDGGFNVNKMDVHVQRAALFEALYPDGVAGGSAQEALEVALAIYNTGRCVLGPQREQLLLQLRLKQRLSWTEIFAHSPNQSSIVLRNAYKRLLDQDPTLAEAEAKLVVQKGKLVKFLPTPDEAALLLDLRNNQKLKWGEIRSYFPGYTKASLTYRYKELSKTELSKKELPAFNLTSEEFSKVAILRASKHLWSQIANEFPEHNIRDIKRAFARETSKLAPLSSRKRRSTSPESGEKRQKASPELSSSRNSVQVSSLPEVDPEDEGWSWMPFELELPTLGSGDEGVKGIDVNQSHEKRQKASPESSLSRNSVQVSSLPEVDPEDEGWSWMPFELELPTLSSGDEGVKGIDVNQSHEKRQKASPESSLSRNSVQVSLLPEVDLEDEGWSWMPFELELPTSSSGDGGVEGIDVNQSHEKQQKASSELSLSKDPVQVFSLPEVDPEDEGWSWMPFELELPTSSSGDGSVEGIDVNQSHDALSSLVSVLNL